MSNVDIVTLGMAAAYTNKVASKLSEEMVKSVTQAIAPIQEDVGNLESTKVSFPVTNSTPNYGTAGQFAVSDGNGGITWKTLVEAEGVDY